MSSILTPLSQVQLFLIENVFQALVVSENIVLFLKQVVSPNFQRRTIVANSNHVWGNCAYATSAVPTVGYYISLLH